MGLLHRLGGALLRVGGKIARSIACCISCRESTGKCCTGSEQPTFIVTVARSNGIDDDCTDCERILGEYIIACGGYHVEYLEPSICMNKWGEGAYYEPPYDGLWIGVLPFQRNGGYYIRVYILIAVHWWLSEECPCPTGMWQAYNETNYEVYLGESLPDCPLSELDPVLTNIDSKAYCYQYNGPWGCHLTGKIDVPQFCNWQNITVHLAVYTP